MSVISGIFQSEATKDAADTSADAANAAAATQYKMFQEQQALMEPWRTSGYNALNQLNAMMGLPQAQGSQRDAINQGRPVREGGGDFVGAIGSNLPAPSAPQDWRSLMDPGYEFRKQEGINALSAAGAASGNYGSGNMGVALQDYGQNIASQEFQNVYNRLAGISGTGQVQSQQMGNMGMETGNVMANYLNQAGQNIAQGQIAGANALAGGVRDLEKGIGAYYMFGGGGGVTELGSEMPWLLA
jgi:hypothetical protein